MERSDDHESGFLGDLSGLNLDGTSQHRPQEKPATERSPVERRQPTDERADRAEQPYHKISHLEGIREGIRARPLSSLGLGLNFLLEEPMGMHAFGNGRPAPQTDGDSYLRDAFGGFGPGSPEYDDNGKRLQIVIEDLDKAVAWFNNPTVMPGHGRQPRKIFRTAISPDEHPKISQLNVEFSVHETGAMLISGTIDTNAGFLDGLFSSPLIPKQDQQGRQVNTHASGQKLLNEHMAERLSALYPGQVGTTEAEEGKQPIVLNVEEGIKLHILFDSMYSKLQVTVNGSERHYSGNRFGSAPKPSHEQLKKELLALQQCYPDIAEAFADFFRKQLPKTVIELDVNDENSDENRGETDVQSSDSDPTNPHRLKQLRQELLVEPQADDFKYIGGLEREVGKLQEAALAFADPETFRSWGVEPPRGILMQGPPGTGKTSMAMAFVHEIDAVMLNVRASNIKNAFHGETERNIRGVFQLADELAGEGKKVVIFFDEIESLAPRRDAMSSSGIDRNVTTELLQAMNKDRPNCIIIAATNAPDMVDRALLLNNSRFSEKIEIPLPDADARTDILHKLLERFNSRVTDGQTLFVEDLDIDMLVRTSDGLTGGDLQEAIRKALSAKAVSTIKAEERAAPLETTQLYQRVQDVIVQKDASDQNYLAN